MAPFEQVQDMTVALKRIILRILNELLQNADDAGSREFKLCLDLRQNAHAKRNKSLVAPELASQGRALYQYNDMEFRDDDFVSIQRPADGTKMGDPTKTGQFGVRFKLNRSHAPEPYRKTSAACAP
jgi:hypothetical protein